MQIKPHDIHVWITDLSLPAHEGYRHLSRDERERADRFQFTVHRERFIAAHYYLRQILGLYLDQPAESIHFAYSEHKKPSLLTPSPAGLHFNLSHSHDIAIYAFTLQHEIGIDIEKMKEAYEDRVAKRYFSPKEYEALMQLPGGERSAAFYRIWACKEALIKAIGTGLSTPLSTFSVTPSDLLQTLSIANETWTLAPLFVHDDYASALATNQVITEISYWRFFEHKPKLDKVYRF